METHDPSWDQASQYVDGTAVACHLMLDSPVHESGCRWADDQRERWAIVRQVDRAERHQRPSLQQWSSNNEALLHVWPVYRQGNEAGHWYACSSLPHNREIDAELTFFAVGCGMWPAIWMVAAQPSKFGPWPRYGLPHRSRRSGLRPASAALRACARGRTGAQGAAVLSSWDCASDSGRLPRPTATPYYASPAKSSLPLKALTCLA